MEQRKLWTLIIALLIALIGVLFLAATTSCENVEKHFIKSEVKKADIESCLDSIVNPRFTSVSDVLRYKSRIENNAFIDSVFTIIPQTTLRNVTSVVLKRLSSASKGDIVEEYMINKHIYENLPPPDNTQTIIQNLTPTNENKQVDKQDPKIRNDDSVTTVAYNYRDTIINGKKMHIQTKTITYELSSSHLSV